MPRKPREKSSEAIYHIICRSISETLLFRDDEDKDYYLKLLKVCSSKYKCCIYAYCLMDNHLHIHLDPRGYDVSSFMHSLNTSYVIYFNKKYSRHGHLFQERFHSEIVGSDRYNLALSAYIHNNPKDIVGYKGREEEYKYSSYGIYLRIRKDEHRLIDMSFVRSLFGIKNKYMFVRRYKEFVSKTDIDNSVDQNDSCENNDLVASASTNGRRIIARGRVPKKVIDYIASRLKNTESSIDKTSKKQEVGYNNYKAFTVYVLKAICGMRYRQICEYVIDITLSGCSKLCNRGYELLEQGGLIYKDIFDKIILFDLF